MPGLTGLLLSTGALSPAFGIDVTSYSVVLPITTQTTSITPSAPLGTSITILGQAVTSGQPWAAPTLNLNDNTVSIVVRQSGRRSRTYTVTVTRGKQQAYVKATNTDPGDWFGSSVAIHGDTMVVGAVGEDSKATATSGTQNNNSAAASGAAYVFVRTGDVWSQQAYLKAGNSRAGDLFGRSVAIDGETIIVGAPMEGACAGGVNDAPRNYDCAASGAAYIFVRSGTTWAQQAYLKNLLGIAGGQFGLSVAVSANRAAVGAPSEAVSGLSGVGAVETYSRSGSTCAVYILR